MATGIVLTSSATATTPVVGQPWYDHATAAYGITLQVSDLTGEQPDQRARLSTCGHAGGLQQGLLTAEWQPRCSSVCSTACTAPLGGRTAFSSHESLSLCLLCAVPYTIEVKTQKWNRDPLTGPAWLSVMWAYTASLAPFDKMRAAMTVRCLLACLLCHLHILSSTTCIY